MSSPLTISTVRRSRGRLRSVLSSAEREMLEEIALQMRASKLRILRGSYLGACLSISRQRANEILRRLESLKLITRFKTGLMRLNLEILNDISPTGAKTVRRKVSNWLKSLSKSRRGKAPFPNKEKDTLKASDLPSMDRASALAALRDTYIPLHLRQSR